MSKPKKDVRTDMFERMRGAKALLSSVHSPKREAELEVAAFMSIFHPDKGK